MELAWNCRRNSYLSTCYNVKNINLIHVVWHARPVTVVVGGGGAGGGFANHSTRLQGISNRQRRAWIVMTTACSLFVTVDSSRQCHGRTERTWSADVVMTTALQQLDVRVDLLRQST